MLSRFGVLLIICLLSAPELFAEDRKDISTGWNELSKTAGSRRVRMVLPNGVPVEGKIVAVEPERLELEITRTANPKVQQKGRTFVPRRAVSVVEIIKHRHRWRVTGAIVGPMLIAVAAGSALRFVRSDDLGRFAGITSAGMAGAGVAGYYVGKRADRSVMTVHIIPEVN